MDVAKLREFSEVSDALIDARRKHGLLAEILDHAGPKAVKALPGAWVRKLRLAIDDLFDALDDGEDEILRRRAKRERARDEGEDKKRKPKRPDRVLGAAQALSRDPSSVPGAIRLVLSRYPEGLLARDLIEKVKEVRPETADASVSSALHPMTKRRELAREGFHKSYRYVLAESPSRPESEEASVSE